MFQIPHCSLSAFVFHEYICFPVASVVITESHTEKQVSLR